MEFVRVSENEDLEVFEATEPVGISGKTLETGLKSFEGRPVVACGFDGGRLWIRVGKKPTKAAAKGAE